MSIQPFCYAISRGNEIISSLYITPNNFFAWAAEKSLWERELPGIPDVLRQSLNALRKWSGDSMHLLTSCLFSLFGFTLPVENKQIVAEPIWNRRLLLTIYLYQSGYLLSIIFLTKRPISSNDIVGWWDVIINDEAFWNGIVANYEDG
jgi:hypothetical protein